MISLGCRSLQDLVSPWKTLFVFDLFSLLNSSTFMKLVVISLPTYNAFSFAFWNCVWIENFLLWKLVAGGLDPEWVELLIWILKSIPSCCLLFVALVVSVVYSDQNFYFFERDGCLCLLVQSFLCKLRKISCLRMIFIILFSSLSQLDCWEIAFFDDICSHGRILLKQQLKLCL